MQKPNWNNTLNQALEAGNVCPSVWPLGLNINYGETASIVCDGLFVSVCRDERGMYETAVSYTSQCEDFQRVVRGI